MANASTCFPKKQLVSIMVAAALTSARIYVYSGSWRYSEAKTSILQHNDTGYGAKSKDAGWKCMSTSYDDGKLVDLCVRLILDEQEDRPPQRHVESHEIFSPLASDEVRCLLRTTRKISQVVNTLGIMICRAAHMTRNVRPCERD